MKLKNTATTGQGLTHPKESYGDISKCIMPKDLNGGYVYVAKSDIGLVKIGKTRNVPARMKSLSSGSGIVIVEVASFGPALNYGEIESRAHARLAEERRSGEWFSADFDAVKSVVASIADKRTVEPGIPEEDEWRIFMLCLWLDAHKAYSKIGESNLSLLSEDAQKMLSAYGYACLIHIANYLENHGGVILADGSMGHQIYPFGYRRAPLSELESDWIKFADHEHADDEGDKFSDCVIDISFPEKFKQEAEKSQLNGVNRVYVEMVKDAQLWMAKRMGAYHA